MVNVKVFGVARLQTGVGSFDSDARTLDELKGKIPGLTRKEAEDLVIFVNGKSVVRKCCLKDGDEVVLLSPAGGG